MNSVIRSNRILIKGLWIHFILNKFWSEIFCTNTLNFHFLTENVQKMHIILLYKFNKNKRKKWAVVDFFSHFHCFFPNSELPVTIWMRQTCALTFMSVEAAIVCGLDKKYIWKTLLMFFYSFTVRPEFIIGIFYIVYTLLVASDN